MRILSLIVIFGVQFVVKSVVTTFKVALVASRDELPFFYLLFFYFIKLFI